MVYFQPPRLQPQFRAGPRLSDGPLLSGAAVNVSGVAVTHFERVPDVSGLDP